MGVQTRIGVVASAAGAASMGGPGFYGRLSRSSGMSTSSSSRSAGTRMKRGVWYFVAVFPPRVRHGLPAGIHSSVSRFVPSVEAVSPIRDAIETRVRALISEVTSD